MFNRTLKQSLTVALLAGASWIAHGSANAGELTLFSEGQFSGREITVNNSVSDLSRAGFNDRAASLVVRSGRWQVCEHANFEGQCVLLDRGEYANLRGLGRRVSSLREVDSRMAGAYDQRDGWRQGRDYDLRQGRDYDNRQNRDYDNRQNRDYDNRAGRADGRQDGRYDQDYQNGADGGAAVEMYRRPQLRGESRELNEASMRSFTGIDFNDRAQSLLVRYGEWEFCEHANFRGNCQVYGPGRYPQLGHMGRKYSSARRVR